MLIYRFVIEFLAKLYDFEMVNAIETGDGWGGYYIAGPAYLILRQSLMAWSFIMWGCIAAPAYERVVRIALTAILGGSLLVGLVAAFMVTHEHHNVRPEFIIRNVVFVLASLGGIIYAFQPKLTNATKWPKPESSPA